MISLFIDTSFTSVSISILKNDKILSIIEKDIPNEHSIYVTQFIKDALDEAKVNANDVDNIMVVNGPGSFTGVRIGVTIAKTYGYLIKKDITPISSLKSLAISSGYDGNIMSIVSANHSNYYVGVYDSNYNILYREEFANSNKAIELINKYHPYVVSTDNSVLGNYKFNKVKLDIPKIVNYYKDKDKVNFHKIVPNYLKLPQALEDKK